MSKYRFLWKWPAAILIFTLILAACSQEDPTATPEPEVQEEPAAEPETAVEPASIAPADYQNIPWAWVAFSDPVEGPQDIPQPERYQLLLAEDGSVSVKADCNNVSGTYTVEGGSITIELGPSTMVACEGDSHGSQFVQNLTAARIMFFDGADMMFDLFADSGTMRFTDSSSMAPEISQPIYLWGEVADRLWVLVAYDDALNPTVVEEGLFITASFSSSEGQVNGSAGCNNYFGSYESTDDGGLTMPGPFGVTMMACENGMEEESAYLGALETVTGWTLTEEGRLELAYDSGTVYDQKLVYAPGETPLTGPTWLLVSYGDPEELQSLEENTSITAEFVAESDTTGVVGGNATCNSYTTGYTLDGDQITVGPIAGTMMMCSFGSQPADHL